MHPLIPALVVLGVWVVVAWRRGQSDDLGTVPVPSDALVSAWQQHAIGDRWYDDLRVHETPQETTRQRAAREQAERDAAIVAKRDAEVERRRQVEALAHRPVPFQRKRVG